MSKIYNWRYDTWVFALAKITANLSGVEAEVEIVDPQSEKAQSKEWKDQKGHMKFPIYENADGVKISECNALAQYFAREGGRKDLYGENAIEEAQIDQWQYIASTTVGPNLFGLAYTSFGYNPSKATYEGAVAGFKKAAELYNNALEGKSYLVGERLTLADLSSFFFFSIASQTIFDAEFRKTVPNFAAWWKKISELPDVVKETGYLRQCEVALPVTHLK